MFVLFWFFFLIIFNYLRVFAGEVYYALYCIPAEYIIAKWTTDTNTLKDMSTLMFAIIQF